jgi:hypothetical protein
MHFSGLAYWSINEEYPFTFNIILKEKVWLLSRLVWRWNRKSAKILDLDFHNSRVSSLSDLIWKMIFFLHVFPLLLFWAVRANHSAINRQFWFGNWFWHLIIASNSILLYLYHKRLVFAQKMKATKKLILSSHHPTLFYCRLSEFIIVYMGVTV